MDRNLDTQALSSVFQYLNNDDLFIAAQISSSWYQIAKNKCVLKGSIYYIVDKLRMNYSLQWIFKNRQQINNFDLTPSLQISFTNDNNDVNVPDGCPCRTRQFNSFTVNIKSHYTLVHLEELNPLLTLYFPAKSLAELTTYIFINESIADKYLCEKLCFNNDEDKKKLKTLLAKLSNLLNKINPKSTVLIILSQPNYFVKFLDLCRNLLNWRFPLNEMIIWGAIIDVLSVCRFSLRRHYCRIDTELLLIFITNPALKIYTEYLDRECDSAEKIQTKLRRLKEEIELSLYSIALMHVSSFRVNEFYALDTSIFKEVFPDIYLFPLYGDASFSGVYLEELMISTSMPFFQDINQCTNILILSHD